MVKLKNIRKAYFAGRFYPAEKSELNQLIEKIFQQEKSKIKTALIEKKIIGGVVPHAGYIFSAYQAVHFFELIRKSEQKFDTIVIVNPSHTGYGEDISLSDDEAWETPFGDIDVDLGFSAKTGLKFSKIAHEDEHSGEVMLPLLKYFLDYEFKIVPICIKTQNPDTAKQTAEAIYKAGQESNKEILVIASSDFSHFVSPDFGKVQDDYVIDEILKLNTTGIYHQVKKHNVSCCGYGPIMALVEYSKLVSEHPKVEILKRGHSGEVYPADEVVDYVSMLAFD
ncbi:MAG: AmmeMemoRadiSam system protein B [Bacteroidota bacterium]|nr:AmmeMemoRadiSam system protein B [Bacteroidota bacterium]